MVAHGASTSAQIAAGVRARRSAVDEELLAGRFVEAPTPEGGNPRARYWIDPAVTSQGVLPRPKGQRGRAAAMLAVLSDGRLHSREEIFAKAGRFFLTNNAASQLRALGHDVRMERVSGTVYGYRLAGRPAAPSALRVRQAPTKARSAVAYEEAA